MEIIQLILQSEFVKSNTLNFIIVLAFLVWIISKINIGKKLEAKRNEIKTFVDESENEKKYSQNKLQEINDKIEKLPEEIKEIEFSTQNSIENMELKSQNIVEEKINDITNNTKRIMDLETKKFKSKLSAILSETGINLARDNAIKQLENNRDMHDKYIYDAIEEIDGISL